MDENRNIKDIPTFIKKLLKENNISTQTAANVLGIQPGSFRNKLSLNRFTLTEYMTLLEMCKYHLAFQSDNQKECFSVITDDVIDNANDIKMRLDEFKNDRLNNEAIENFLHSLNLEELNRLTQIISEEVKK